MAAAAPGPAMRTPPAKRRRPEVVGGARRGRSLASRVRRDDVSEAAPSISRGAPLPDGISDGMRLDRLVQDPRAEGQDNGFGVCLLPMPI